MSVSTPAAYVRRVDGISFNSFVMFTLHNLKLDDTRVYGCMINATTPGVSAFDNVKLPESKSLSLRKLRHFFFNFEDMFRCFKHHQHHHHRACCNACYIGESGRHFFTRVREHLFSDKSSHIFKHLLSSERCRQSCSADCLEILDSAPSKF